MIRPLLVVALGNPSRGDDALGPLLLDYIEQELNVSAIELISDFQLQIEHALDLQSRELVLFVDAAVGLNTAFRLDELKAAQDRSYTSHAMSPAAVLEVYRTTLGMTPPPCFLLSVQGVGFALGGELSGIAAHNLRLASQFARQLLAEPTASRWRQRVHEDLKSRNDGGSAIFAAGMSVESAD